MARGRKLHKSSVHRWCTRVCHEWCNPLETIPEDEEFVPSLQVQFPSQDDKKPTKGIKLVISLKKIHDQAQQAHSSAANNHGNKKRKASQSILSHYSEKFRYAKLNKISTTSTTWPQAHQSAAATAA